MITMKTRMLSVSALLVLGGMVAYIYNGSPVDSLQSDRSISASSAPSSALSSAQIEINDAAKTASTESVEAPADAMQAGHSLASGKVVSAVRNDAHIGDGEMKGQYQANAVVNSNLLSQSILSSRARVERISSALHAGLSLEQRRAQMKYQVSFREQQLSLLRNQLRQMQWNGNKPQQGKATLGKGAVNALQLKSHVRQLESQLAMQQHDLKRFQKQFPVFGQFATRPTTMMGHQAHHRWN